MLLTVLVSISAKQIYSNMLVVYHKRSWFAFLWSPVVNSVDHGKGWETKKGGYGLCSQSAWVQILAYQGWILWPWLLFPLFDFLTCESNNFIL